MNKLIPLLALLAAFPPLSTDMYLAAIPRLVSAWQQPLAVVNLTLVGFFATYCCFLLVYGPLSDRFGRKPPLLTGLCLYTLASLGCAAAGGIQSMILFRILQGAGAAAASAIVFAICKDRFAGNRRQRLFLQLGVIVAGAPMIAPIIGGWIIEQFSWRWIFIGQAAFGVIAAGGTALMRESLPEPGDGSLRAAFSGYLRLLRNGRFSLLTMALSVIGIPFFAFIAISADIYIGKLGYSAQAYGWLFAANASAFILAPLIFSRAARKFRLTRLLPASYLGVLLAALPMIPPILPMPYRLAVPMWAVTFCFAFGRPPGNNLILEQVDRDVGTASGLMVFIFFMTGSLSMWFSSLGWQNGVGLLGILGAAAAATTLSAWVALNRCLELRLPSRDES